MKRLYPILLSSLLLLGACAKIRTENPATAGGDVAYGETGALLAGAMATMEGAVEARSVCADNAECLRPLSGGIR